jgi:MoaA/NifB/PqqE/SkfB family radical SAM enzyme
MGHYNKMWTQFRMAIKNPGQAARVARSEILTRLGVRTLRSVEFQVTHGCDLDCEFCYAADIMKSPDRRGNMKLEKIREILAECHKLGMIHVNITGGEPLLRKDVLDIIGSIPKSVVVSLVTNSGLLTKPLLDDMKAAGLSTLQMSYGSNYKGFNLELARYCVDIGLSVTLSIVNIREERDYNQQAIDMACEYGFNVLYNYPMRFNNTGLDSEFYWRYRGESYVREDNLFWSGRNKCPAGMTKIYITNDGDVSSCDRIHDFAGNLHESSVEDIWKKMRLEYAKRPSFCLLETNPEQWETNNRLSGKHYPATHMGSSEYPFNILKKV